MAEAVTVAIPARNGGPGSRRRSPPCARSGLDRELELLVADSGSTDGSADAARAVRRHRASGSSASRTAARATADGALAAARTSPSSRRTRCRPADDWLAALLAAFALADDVALVCGPYIPRPDAPPPGRARAARLVHVAVARRHAARLPRPRAARARRRPSSSRTPTAASPARRGSRCRSARSPTPRTSCSPSTCCAPASRRRTSPSAAVVHSHAYPPVRAAAAHVRRVARPARGARLGRAGRALRPPARSRAAARDWRELRAEGAAAPHARARDAPLGPALDRALAAGAALGSRADRLPPARARRALARAPIFSFEPVQRADDTPMTRSTTAPVLARAGSPTCGGAGG